LFAGATRCLAFERYDELKFRDDRRSSRPASPRASATTHIPPNAIPTFGIFVPGSGAFADMPGVNRIFVTFTDGSGTPRGETSVACTQ
jgi:hypothetical protein